MSWEVFLTALCKRPEYGLTIAEIEVLMCLEPDKCPTKNSLLATYSHRSPIEVEAFTQRLKNIYKKFQINGQGHKLPQLHQYLTERYLQYQRKDAFFAEIGLTYIHPNFPRDKFGCAIDAAISSTDPHHHHIDILQTFAPNLDHYAQHLIRAIDRALQVRILLAWPYSQAAKLREDVLRKYAQSITGSEIDIRDRTIANLETLEKILFATNNSQYLDIRLYDTLPSMAIYRAGNYLVAAPFLHGSLAIDTFQIELQLDTNSSIVTETLLDDFELMWRVARRFQPTVDRHWRNDLKILFTT